MLTFIVPILFIIIGLYLKITKSKYQNFSYILIILGLINFLLKLLK